MVITGKVFEIRVLSDKLAQIVLRKKMDNKLVYVSFNVFGYWKQKIEENNLKPKDKIKANVYMKSKEWNGKWITDVYFKEVYIIEVAPLPMMSKNLFSDEFMDFDGNSIDLDTGEKLN